MCPNLPGHLCAGKTTFAQAIYRALGEQHVTYITHDSYYKDLGHLPVEARAKQNFDHPDALDTALLVQHIRALKYGSSDAYAYMPNRGVCLHIP